MSSVCAMEKRRLAVKCTEFFRLKCSTFHLRHSRTCVRELKGEEVVCCVYSLDSKMARINRFLIMSEKVLNEKNE